MGDDAFSISEYINEDWKEDGKLRLKAILEDGQPVNGTLMCYFHQNKYAVKGQATNLRNYTSFDRRCVEFLKAQYLIQYMSVEQEEKLIKRTKSKFNTLKRRYKQKSKYLQSKISQLFDFQELIYQQAKKIWKKDHTSNLKQFIQYFQTLKEEKINMHESQHSDTSPQRLVSLIKTRSFTNKQKQIGTNKK